MRPSSLSLSSSLPSTDNPSRYPSFLVSVLIERTFVPSSVSRNCARKNISSGRRLDIVISRACRIGNGSMFRRRLRRDGRIELRSSTGTFPHGGNEFPRRIPGRIYCDTGDPRTNLPSPARNTFPVRLEKSWRLARPVQMDGACTKARRGSRGIEKHAANPCSSLLLSRRP